jgi:hypothetical protein
VADLEKQMQEAGADVMTEQISADIATQLEAGRQVAYTALSTQDALAVKRTAVGEDEADVSGFVLTEDGLVAGEAVVTEEGIAAHRLVATEEGVTEEVVVASYEATEEDTVAGEAVAAPEEEEEETPEEGAA